MVAGLTLRHPRQGRPSVSRPSAAALALARGRLAHEAEDVSAGQVVGRDGLGAEPAHERVVELEPRLAAARRGRAADGLVVPAALRARARA